MRAALWFARHGCMQPCGLLGMDACSPVVWPQFKVFSTWAELEHWSFALNSGNIYRCDHNQRKL